MSIAKCSVEGCKRDSRCWGMCSMHFQRARKFGDPNIRMRQAKGETEFCCTVEGCTLPHKAKGYCYVHYQRFKRFGSPHEVHRNLNGEGTIVPDGYKKITLSDGTRVLEHRYVMEVHIGRKLESWEVVHHIDGNRLNNSLENLELIRDQSLHAKNSPGCLSALKEGRKCRWTSKSTGD